MNVKGIEVTLVTLAKANAIMRGQTLTEWIREAMEERLKDGLGKVERVESPSEVPGVRGGVRNDTGKQGRARGSGAATVQRPSHKPPSNADAVGRSVQQDSGGPGVCERPFVGPAHAKMCGCDGCKARRRAELT